jgi:hypothetical protein
MANWGSPQQLGRVGGSTGYLSMGRYAVGGRVQTMGSIAKGQLEDEGELRMYG